MRSQRSGARRAILERNDGKEYLHKNENNVLIPASSRIAIIIEKRNPKCNSFFLTRRPESDRE